MAVVLAVLLLLAMPTAVSAAGVTVTSRTGDGAWINNTWQVSIYPGETKSTTLTLYNSSSSTLEVEITPPDPLDNGNLTFELDKAKFAISGRSYVDVTLTVKASGGATPGIYTAELSEIKSETAPRDRVTPAPPPPVLEPEEEEPEVVEPETEEPEAEEPEEPEVVEPVEEPEVEEPEVVEPEVEEPEVIEPGEEEEEIIVLPAKPGTPWGLIGGIVGGLAATGGVGYWLWLWLRRRKKEENDGS